MMLVAVAAPLLFCLVAAAPSLSAAALSVDLSLDLVEAVATSPGSLAIDAAAIADPAIRTAVVLEHGKVAASYVRSDVDPSMPVRTASVTKSWTGLLIGILIDEGKLALNETLGEVLPDNTTWDGVEDVEFRRAITVSSLEGHSNSLVSRGEQESNQ